MFLIFFCVVNTVALAKKVVVVGSTGYIGKFVTKELSNRGFSTTAVVRPGGGASRLLSTSEVKVVEADVTDPSSVRTNVFQSKSADVVISCLASRSGVKQDSFAIDYQATLNVLKEAKEAGVGHFILLSAFCVRKPLLQFQFAKLDFEKALIEACSDGTMRYSIVRPTAFFKSVSGQFELLQQGWPFVMFGDGEICKCNPIAESDLAAFMVNCIDDESKWNKAIDLGGPDDGMTMKQQGEMIFKILQKEPKFWKVPIGLFDVIIDSLAFLGKFSPKFEDAAELGRIGKYYAVEDMLTTKQEEKFGKITLQQHYEKINVEGQEYDPYTTMLASKKK